MSEKLCLKWNDFQENVKSTFWSLREDNEFADVTLACGDGQQIEAHKVILAASSPFYQNLLRRNRNPHPLIYMRGMKSENLQAVVDFLYCGEANLFQENLDSFLAIAEELQLKGLVGQTEDAEKRTTESNYTNQMDPKPFHEREKSILVNEQIQTNLEPKLDKQPPNNNVQGNHERRVSIPNFVSGAFQELDEKVKSLMEISQNLDPRGKQRAKICKVCGKEGDGTTIRDHIEANHLKGVSLPCNVCGKTFRSKIKLKLHKCALLNM